MPTITAEVREVLDQPAVAVLTVARTDGARHQTVVWYRLADQALHVVSEGSKRKVGHIRSDPRVSLVVVHPDNEFAYVVIEGTAQVIEDDERARSESRLIASRYLGAAAADWVGRMSADPRVLLVVSIERIRASLRPPALEQLEQGGR